MSNVHGSESSHGREKLTSVEHTPPPPPLVMTEKQFDDMARRSESFDREALRRLDEIRDPWSRSSLTKIALGGAAASAVGWGIYGVTRWLMGPATPAIEAVPVLKK
jgi:hypothetical protein